MKYDNSGLDRYRKTITVKKNEKENKTYTGKTLENLAKGNYASRKEIPYVKPTVSKSTTTKQITENTVPKNAQTVSNASRPSTRYQQNVNTEPKKTTRDTRYDKDFDTFFNYRLGDFSGEVDYDPVQDADVEKWRNVKKDIMAKNKWSENEFDSRWDEYINERNQKAANAEVQSGVDVAKKNPILGTLLQAAYTPQNMIEGGAAMLSNLAPEKYKAQSADDTLFTGTRTKEGIKQTVKDEHIKSKVGKGAYDIGTSLADMVMASAVPGLGVASLGTQAAARQNMQALERGVDPNKAALTGAASGVISGLMNKVGLDKALGAAGKTALGTVGKAAVREGLENVVEDVANYGVDAAINRNKSQLNTLHDYYVGEGMSDDDAWSQVIKDTGLDLTTSALSGAAFGGVMSGVRNIPALTKEIGDIAKKANIDNKGGVDAPALIEEARKAMKAPAKVEGAKGNKLVFSPVDNRFDNAPVEEGPNDGKLTSEEVNKLEEGIRELESEGADEPNTPNNDRIKEIDDNLAKIDEKLKQYGEEEPSNNNEEIYEQIKKIDEQLERSKDFDYFIPQDELFRRTNTVQKARVENIDRLYAEYNSINAQLENLPNMEIEDPNGLYISPRRIEEYKREMKRDLMARRSAVYHELDTMIKQYLSIEQAALRRELDANPMSSEDALSGNVRKQLQQTRDRLLQEREELLNRGSDGGDNVPPTNNTPVPQPTEPTIPENVPETSNGNEPPRRSFFDDLSPRSDKTGISKVGTNSAVNAEIFTKDQIDNDPVISELNKYAKANNDLTFNKAKENIYNEGATLLDEYTNGKRSINSDLDVDQAMILLTDMAQKIKAGDKGLEAQRNLLFSRLREAGTLYGQTIQAFKKWNNTPEGAIINGEKILQEPVERWKSKNKKQKEFNNKIAKALEQMGVDNSMRNRTKAEKTHEQIKEGVKNVIEKEFGSVEQYFNDNDLEFLTTLAEEKQVPVWQITDEIEHKLATGEWYTLDESTQPKYPVNQRLKSALDSLVAQDPAVKEPPTLDEIKNEVRTTLDSEMARTGEFTDDDVNYLSTLIYNGATKEELAEALNTKMATGKFGISDQTQQDVYDLFAYADRFDPNSKQAYELKSAAYKLLAEETVSENASPLEKFESWRYLAMLGNPKTMMRNFIGNKLFGVVTGVSNNLSAALEAGVDKASRVLGGEGIQRTKTFLNPVDDRALIKASAEDGDLHRYTDLIGSKYEKGTKEAIKEQKSVFNSKLLRLYEAATDRGISDYSAVKKKYSTSLAGYMKANGLDESAFDADDRYRNLLDKSRSMLLTDAEKAEMNRLKNTADLLEKARDYAVKQAEYATFHEPNVIASMLTSGTQVLRKGDIKINGKTYHSHAAQGLGYALEGMLPFKKTPANILRSGAEYSPLNAINSIWHTGKLIYENTGKRKGNLDDVYLNKKGREVNKSLAADVIDSWSKTLTGSGLVWLGYFLKNHGILNSSNKDEKGQDDLEGIQNYSITINGMTFTLDWATPAVMPLILGAEISKIKDRSAMLDQKWYENADAIGETINALLDPMFEISMLSNIKDTVEESAKQMQYNENGPVGGVLGSIAMNTATGYATQGIPTVLGQIARTVDNTRRTTDTATQSAMLAPVEKQARKIINKIPGLSMINQPYYDAYGRTQSNSPTNNPIVNLAYQMGMPSYIRDINTTDADKQARDVYYGKGEDGKPIMDSKVFPAWKSTVKVSGEKFSPEEMASYRKTSGEAQYAIRDALAKEEWFNNLDASKQTELLKKVNTLVDKIGKDSVGKLDSSSKELETYQDGGIPDLLNKWRGEEGSNIAKEETGLSGRTNAIKEIDAAYAKGDTKKAEELTEKYKKQNEERLRLNEKYGVNIKMSDFTKREDANPGSNEEWAKEHATTTNTSTTNKVPEVKNTNVDTTGYEKQIERAGKQNKKFTNDLPKLKELNYGKSEMYTYAYAINQDSSLTPQKFDTQFKSMDADKSGSLKQDELINYFNKNNTSQQQAKYLWKTYGENKGSGWKTQPVLKDGTWKKQK